MSRGDKLIHNAMPPHPGRDCSQCKKTMNAVKVRGITFSSVQQKWGITPQPPVSVPMYTIQMLFAVGLAYQLRITAIDNQNFPRLKMSSTLFNPYHWQLQHIGAINKTQTTFTVLDLYYFHLFARKSHVFSTVRSSVDLHSSVCSVWIMPDVSARLHAAG